MLSPSPFPMPCGAASLIPVTSTVLVTGATAGIGYHAAEQLAAAGHRVLLAGRDPQRSDTARASILRHAPGADVEIVPLDLADQVSVARAAAQLAQQPPDAVIANAALVSYSLRPEEPQRTAEGIELHFATAFLGHYALIARLLPQLEERGSRIVLTGSLSHRLPLGKDPWSRVVLPRREPSFVSYTRSKQAVTILGMALARSFAVRSAAAACVLAHPGVAVDVLTPAREGIAATQPMDISPISRAVVSRTHGKDAGAAILVHAATAPGIRNGDCIGPSGPRQLSGPPRTIPPPPGRPRYLVADLLSLSAEITGVGLPG